MRESGSASDTLAFDSFDLLGEAQKNNNFSIIFGIFRAVRDVSFFFFLSQNKKKFIIMVRENIRK